MSKMLFIDSELCTGCRMCELRCSFKHDRRFDISRSRIRVVRIEEQGVYVPITCVNCEEAYCIAVCPTLALKRDVDNHVVLHNEICIGCKMCVTVCPYGAITLDKNGTVLKCDSCGGDPECVKFCPTDALRYVRPERFVYKNRVRSAISLASSKLPDKEERLRRLYYAKTG